MILPLPSVWPMLGFLFMLAMAGAGLGIWLAEVPAFARRVVPFGGGVLLGIALFWVLPEIATRAGWITALTGLLCGFGLLWSIDRCLHPVCTSCSHPLHGFAAPLLAAAAIHAFFDGWSVAVSQDPAWTGLRLIFLAGVGIHKLPEGLALGALLIAATGSTWKAAAGSAAAQSAMLLGACAAAFMAGHLLNATSAFLAVAAGIFVYLGYHAFKGQAALAPALTGAAGAAILRFVPGL